MPPTDINDRALCDLKQRLLYIELITTKGLLNLFNRCSLPLLAHHETSLKTAKDYYKHYEKVKEDKASNFTILGHQFETHVATLYKSRSILWRQLETLLPYQTTALAKEEETLDNLDYQLDLILRLLNHDRSLPPNRREHYEHTFEQWIKNFPQTPFSFARWLPHFLKEMFPQAQRVMTVLQVYRLWQNHFNKETEKLTEKATLGFQDILTIKRLLYTNKHPFLKAWMQQLKKSPEKLIELFAKEVWLAQQGNSDHFQAASIVQHLKNQLATLQAEITQQEKAWLQRYSWRQDIDTGIVRMLTENSYYTLSETGFSALEDGLNTRPLQSIPVVNVQLTENYRRFFKAATASVILIWELSESTNIGVPFLLLSTVSRWASNDYNNWCRFYKRMGKDDYDFIPAQEKLRIGTGFVLTLGSQIIRSWWMGLGWSWSLVGLTSGWYGVATAGQKGFSKLAGWLVGGKDYQLSPSVSAFCEYSGYTLASKGFLKVLELAWPSLEIYTPNAPNPDHLLLNNELCQRHLAACQHAARQKLNVSETASHADIRALCRELALRNHPDKTTDNDVTSNQIVVINNACQVLRK